MQDRTPSPNSAAAGSSAFSAAARRAARNPRLLWRTLLKPVDGTLVAARDGRLFVPAGGQLQCLDAGGRVLWAAETTGRQGSPALDDTRVYVGDDGGTLLALDRRTGRVAWRFTLRVPPGGSSPAAFLTRPAVTARTVFAEGTDGTVYALGTGAAGVGAAPLLRWKFARPDGSLGYSDPLHRPAGALYVCGESNLYRLDAATGRERWRARVGGKALAGPAEGGGRVFTGGDGAPLSAFEAATGKPLWTFAGSAAPGGDWFGAPRYAAGTVFIGTHRRYVYAVDAVSGKAKWTARLLGPVLAAPVFDAARQALYVGAETFRNNPTLWALDAASGTVLFNYRAGSLPFSPVLAGNRLYAASPDGYLHAFALA